MQNVSNQPQAPDENERGYAPVLPPEYREVAGPQSGYQQQYYPAGQPYPPYYQGRQQQSWSQQPNGMWASGDVNPL